jgi:hypothetical protein
MERPELGSVIEFVEALELPRQERPPEGLEAPDIALPQPDFTKPTDLLATVGSQIVEFSASVDPDIRPHITNAFLLAQLAANKEAGTNNSTSEAWYNAYLDVLTKIGWVIEGSGTSKQEIKTKNLNVHSEILPVIEAVLGPAVAATSLITTLLKGLGNMSKDKPWITLFDRESQRAKANQFQISNVTGATKNALIKLVCFELDAKKSITQVLFFKFTSSEARLRKFERTLTVNTGVFKQVAPAIEKKVADRIAGSIAGIET